MLEHFKLPQGFLSLSSFFWNLVSSFCSGWIFISSFSKALIWILVSFPSLLVPCTFLFISLYITFTFSSILWPYSTISLSILITSVLNCAFDKWLSLHRLVLFLELSSVLPFGPFFFFSACLICCKGQSLTYSLARAGQPIWLRWGPVFRGCVRDGTIPLAQLSAGFQSLPCHKQIGPFWCWFQGGWVCVCSRSLWVSPKDSPMMLGVSPTAATPQIFTARGFKAFFSHSETLGCVVCLTPKLFLPVYLHTNVGPLATALPAWPSSCCLAVHPLLPSCPSLPRLPVWLNISSLTPWLSDFHAVWLSGSFGYFFVYKFVVLLLVVRGGKVYVLMPPSWLEVIFFMPFPNTELENIYTYALNHEFNLPTFKWNLAPQSVS